MSCLSHSGQSHTSKFRFRVRRPTTRKSHRTRCRRHSDCSWRLQLWVCQFSEGLQHVRGHHGRQVGCPLDGEPLGPTVQPICSARRRVGLTRSWLTGHTSRMKFASVFLSFVSIILHTRMTRWRGSSRGGALLHGCAPAWSTPTPPGRGAGQLCRQLQPEQGIRHWTEENGKHFPSPDSPAPREPLYAAYFARVAELQVASVRHKAELPCPK